VTPLLRTSGDTGAFAATWQPLANLLEAMQRPRKPMTPVDRKRNATPSPTAASTATRRAGHALVRDGSQSTQNTAQPSGHRRGHRPGGVRRWELL